MEVKTPKPLITRSIEDASIIRKFTLLFFLSSVIPMSLLYYVYINHTRLDISGETFSLAMFFMVLGVLSGYYYMRYEIVKIIRITNENRKALEPYLSAEALAEINQGENEIELLSRSFSAVTKQLEANIHNLEMAKKTLQSVMAKVGEGISNMQKIDTFVDLIVETMNNALGAKVSTLMLVNERKTDLVLQSVYGVAFDNSEPVRIKLFPGSPFARILDEKHPQVISGIYLQNMNNQNLNSLFGEKLLCVPLVYQDRVIGMISLTKPLHGTFLDEDIHLVNHLARQTAIAIENSKLSTDVERTYFETISALALAVDAKDKYARGHIDRVAKYVVTIGQCLGLKDPDLTTLAHAARLHDLGKLGIPDEILSKEGELTDEEWVIMKRHPEIGESIIKPIRSLQHLCDPIRHHHEKIDGTGYPDHLKGEEISLLARILAVADIYDALTTDRPYRNKKTREEAFEIMRSMKNHLDQHVVEVFFESMDRSFS